MGFKISGSNVELGRSLRFGWVLWSFRQQYLSLSVIRADFIGSNLDRVVPLTFYACSVFAFSEVGSNLRTR